MGARPGMHDPLAVLLADGVVDEIHGRLKSGKEADLWLVRHGGHTIAAKVYKPRQERSFRNDAGYREGRQVRDTRMQRAMDRGSRFGQAAAEEAWKTKEADALYALHAAGVRVPTPVMFYEGVLLMELVVDAHGHPAPRLVDAHVPRERAAALYEDLRGQMIRMLGCDLIHGDLSPYNILVGSNGPVLIDFPQVVGAAHNSQAESFFRRDVENVRRFLAGIDPSLHAAAGDAHEIWRAYVRRELTPAFVPSGKVPEQRPRPAQRPHGGGPPRPAERAAQRPHGGGSPRPAERAAQRPHGGGSPRPAERAAQRPHGGGSPRPAERAAQRPHGGGSPRPAERAGHRRGPPRSRPATPSPVVVRVVRPPLGSPGASAPAAVAPRTAPRQSAQPGQPGPGARPPDGAQPTPGAHRRRRRRGGERRS